MNAIHSKKIKVLTLNIHKGMSFITRKFMLDKLRLNIRSLDVDLVCLQEVIGQYSNLATEPQFEYLADQIWHHYAYGKNAISSNGHHGNAILSKVPFVTYKNIDISNHRFERRGILYGVLSLPEWRNKALHIMTLHLDLSSWGRKRQLFKLCQLIEEQVPVDQPLIVCGDFNDWPADANTLLLQRVGLTEAHLSYTGYLARTFPSYLPILKLDRIYVRGLEINEVLRLDSQPWRELSDHLPLFAELRF